VQATEEREATRVAGSGSTPTTPVVLGRYHLMRRLGTGGFGTVHEAWDERLDRWVAVKVVPADDVAPHRARREARAAARLDHPNNVSLFDAGEEPGARYLVCELVDGATMAELQAQGRLGDRDVLRIGLAVADALEHAHERGVIHRDVKPQNVLVPADGEGPLRGWPRAGAGAVAKLTDFGVAHLVGEEVLTRTGDVLGTLAYMAPEQARGERVDGRADLYALGLLVYEGLAGVQPVKAGNAAATARRLGTILPSLAEHRPDLPEDLVEAVDAALSPHPDDRDTLAALAMALADALPEVDDERGTIAPHPLERRLDATPLHLRVAAGSATGALCGLAAHGLTPEPLLEPWLLAIAAAAATIALPRLGWLAAILATVLAIVCGPAPRAGAATVVLLAALPIPLLLRRAPAGWTLPAAAPVLGLIAAAVAYPALAGTASTVARRAALGALGVWLLVLAEPLVERTLLLGAPDDVPARDRFDGGVSLAVRDVLRPVLSSPALALAPLWALAAAILPWLVRGRHLAIDVVMATAWAAGLAAATATVATAAGGSPSPELALGAVVAGVLAVVTQRGSRPHLAGY
jgi:hypothetical protein